MRLICLNSKLVKHEPYRESDWTAQYLAEELQHRLGKQYKLIQNNIVANAETQLGFLNMLSTAYSRHEKIEIAPYDIWFLVLSEIASIIKTNEEICRPLFTKFGDKVNLYIPVSNVTSIDIAATIEQLQNVIPIDTKIFIPKLSCTTEDAQIAMYAALCDGVSGYYNYMTFCCGIPEIRLIGTEEDWATLFRSSQTIGALFGSINLSKAQEYMSGVATILADICQTFRIDNRSFWQNIFTQKNIGSGGELGITGWITKLYYDPPKLPKLENFLTKNTIVPYTNVETGRKFKGVYGAFEVARTNDDFLTSRYSSVIFEEK